MSSGIKRCAFGRQCVIAELHAGDRPRGDWTEIQECDCWGKCLIMQSRACSMVKRLAVSEDRRPGRVDDEGNDLLLNSERGAGGVVVSKEEVAAGRKGSGGAWMGVDQPECGAGRASPAKWSNTKLAQKKPNIRSSGCRLQFGSAEWSSSAITLQNSSTIFRHAVRAIRGANAMRVILF
jgi:hypothetical protein